MKRKRRLPQKSAPILEIEALGQKWRFQQFDLENVHDPFMLWARTQMPDYMGEANKANEQLSLQLWEEEQKGAEANRAKIAWLKEQMELILSHALDLSCRYLDWNDPSVVGLRSSPRGMAYLFYLLLRKAHPDITPQKALDVFFHVEPDLMVQVMASVIPGAIVPDLVPHPPE